MVRQSTRSCSPRFVLPTRVGMVLLRRSECQHQRRSPHARGDGPQYAHWTNSDKPFSPRAWGWSVIAITPNSLGEFSPRAWGWSGMRRAVAAFDEVLPTRVGMVRALSRQCSRSSSSPHARGDGPHGTLGPFTAYPFSPRAWGWSGSGDTADQNPVVLPTRVGMVRFRTSRSPSRKCSPHARGDGPLTAAMHGVVYGFSPRAWGWSDFVVIRVSGRGVLPTRVGMVRVRCGVLRARLRFPHARGDGPASTVSSLPVLRFSPRAWGWSLHQKIIGLVSLENATLRLCWRSWKDGISPPKSKGRACTKQRKGYFVALCSEFAIPVKHQGAKRIVSEYAVIHPQSRQPQSRFELQPDGIVTQP